MLTSRPKSEINLGERVIILGPNPLKPFSWQTFQLVMLDKALVYTRSIIFSAIVFSQEQVKTYLESSVFHGDAANVLRPPEHQDALTCLFIRITD